jgi:hypothetical protein
MRVFHQVIAKALQRSTDSSYTCSNGCTFARIANLMPNNRAGLRQPLTYPVQAADLSRR